MGHRTRHTRSPSEISEPEHDDCGHDSMERLAVSGGLIAAKTWFFDADESAREFCTDATKATVRQSPI